MQTNARTCSNIERKRDQHIRAYIHTHTNTHVHTYIHTSYIHAQKQTWVQTEMPLASISHYVVFSPAGTPAFMAPECCTAGAFHGKLADVWAAGVSLYFMVHGKCPFISGNIMKLYEMIQNDPITYDESLPADLLDLLKHILERDPSKRYTVGSYIRHFGRKSPLALDVKPTKHRSIVNLFPRALFILFQ